MVTWPGEKAISEMVAGFTMLQAFIIAAGGVVYWIGPTL